MARFNGWTSEAEAAKKAKPAVLIGIDPGTKTGVALIVHGKLQSVETMTICKAMNFVREWSEHIQYTRSIFVRVEDARQRKWFGKTGTERLKGAGSVERDCSIWQEFLTDLKIHFEMVHPKNVRATTPEQFRQLTGYTKQTSIHAREAAWMIINF